MDKWIKYAMAPVLAVLCLLAAACDKLPGRLYMGFPRSAVLGWGDKRMLVFPDTLGADDGVSRTQTRHAWVSAVVFPDDYDWMRDTAYGAVTGKLRLYKDTLIFMELPAGPGLEASLSAERHTMSCGHFYVWNDINGTTVIRKDGSVAATLPDREALLGLIEDDRGLWTLGRNSEGLRLCCNGESRWSAADGAVHGDLRHRDCLPGGALVKDQGQICFTLCRTESGVPTSYLVTDGTAIQISSQEEILDMIRHGGILRRLIKRGSDGSVILYEGNKTRDISCNETFLWKSAHFMRSLMTGNNNSTVIYGTGRSKADATILTSVWINGSMIGDVAWGKHEVYADPDRWPPFVIIDDYEIPDYFTSGQTCMDADGGHIWIAATPADSTQTGMPVLYKDGEVINTYDLNGYLSGVWIQADPG